MNGNADIGFGVSHLGDSEDFLDCDVYGDYGYGCNSDAVSDVDAGSHNSFDSSIRNTCESLIALTERPLVSTYRHAHCPPVHRLSQILCCSLTFCPI